MRIHVLQHVPFEGLGSIERWTTACDHTVTTCGLYRGDPLPEPSQFDWLIVLGGPMGVYDEARYPWLVAEKRLIEAAIRAEKIVLGICLGAQLIAVALGKKVTRNREREIGWFPLDLTPAVRSSRLFDPASDNLLAFHWHSDTFEIPDGAVRLAGSDACDTQAYLYDKRVLGLQFHLETTPANAQALITNCSDELTVGTYIQTPDEILASPERFETINQHMRGVLNRLVLG